MPPVYSKVNPADTPIVTLAVSSPTLPLTQVEDLVDTRLAPKLSEAPGVGLVSLGGGQRPAVRIQVDPIALASSGLMLEDVRTAIANANVNQAKGSFDGPLRAYTIDANDQLRSADDYRNIAVPLSLVGTFGVMYLAGFSLNNLTLMALTIATGFVVDDAIVMIENISRFVEEGMPRRQAALEGSKQIGFTIISLTISLIAVLIPLLFMGDVVGRLFRQFAVTLAVSILISAFVSLTFTPMMCARILVPPDEKKEGRILRAAGHFFTRLTEQYGRALKWVLDHEKLTLLVAVATLALTAVLYILIPKGFFPSQDTGVIQGITEAPAAISFSQMAQKQSELARVLLKDPAVDTISSYIGVDGTNTTLNSGRMLINLVDKGKRDVDAVALIRRLQPQLARVTGITMYMQPVQDLTIDARVSRTQYQLSAEDPNAAELSTQVGRLVARLQNEPQLSDVASDLQDRGLEVYVNIDRDAAGRLGVTTAAIDNALYDAYGQRLVSTIFTQSNLYRVVLEVRPGDQQNPNKIQDLYVATVNGNKIPLSSVARVSERVSPLVVNHIGQFPSATISFNLAQGASLGADDDVDSRYHRRLNHLSVHRHPEGLFPSARHRPHHGLDSGGPEHLVPGNAIEAR